LTLYEKAVALGVERAQQNVRNVSLPGLEEGFAYESTDIQVKAKIVAAKAEAADKASKAEDNLKVNIDSDSTTNRMQ
jgi:hypothetical protein